MFGYNQSNGFHVVEQNVQSLQITRDNGQTVITVSGWLTNVTAYLLPSVCSISSHMTSNGISYLSILASTLKIKCTLTMIL